MGQSHSDCRSRVDSVSAGICSRGSPARLPSATRAGSARRLMSHPCEEVGLLFFEFCRRHDASVPKLAELLELFERVGRRYGPPTSLMGGNKLADDRRPGSRLVEVVAVEPERVRCFEGVVLSRCPEAGVASGRRLRPGGRRRLTSRRSRAGSLSGSFSPTRRVSWRIRTLIASPS
jgi:hypothetical protein